MRILFCVFFFFLSSFAFSDEQFRESLPDWFFMPSPGGEIGIIGTSSQTLSDSESTSEYARFFATRGFRSIFPDRAKDKDLFDLIIGRKKEIPIKNGFLRFSDSFFSKDTAIERLVYSKSSFEMPLPKPIRNCRFKTCSPGWLCSPVFKNFTGILGVSYEASTFRRQLELTRLNAVRLLEYTFGVTVEGRASLLELSNSAFSVRISKESFKINKDFKSPEIRLFTKEQCFAGKTLISWVVSPDLPEYFTADSLEWTKNPGYKGVFGVIGSSQSDHPFFSARLEEAYRNALNQLSKNKGLSLRSETDVENNGQVRSSEKITIDHKNSLRPRILGIYLDSNDLLKIWAADSNASLPQP